MKKNLLLLVSGLLVVIFAFPLFSQTTCNHRHAFSRSAVADSIDALHYRIHLTDVDFSAKTLQAVITINLVPKLEINHIPLELKYLLVDSVFINGIKTTDFYQQDDVVRMADGNTYGPDDTLSIVIFYGGHLSAKAGADFIFREIMPST